MTARTPPPLTLARLPPLTALRAFVVTARHLSFGGAAAELHVTTAAIGQQIRLLEEHLDTRLFLRNRGELELTEAGRRLEPGLSAAFAAVIDALGEIGSGSADQPVRIAAPAAFAAKWLAPRLLQLSRRLGGAGVEILSEADEGADLTVSFGPTVAGEEASHLFADAVVPVCAPDLALRHGLARGPGVLRGLLLLQEAEPEHGADWRSLMLAEGAPAPDPAAVLTLGDPAALIAAALSGQGLALARLRLAEDDLAARRLVIPFGQVRPLSGSWRLRLIRNGAAAALAQAWLLAEAAGLSGLAPPAAARLAPQLRELRFAAE